MSSIIATLDKAAAALAKSEASLSTHRILRHLLLGEANLDLVHMATLRR